VAAIASIRADAQPRRVQVGTLACSISAGIGLVVASQRNVSCNFQPDGGPPETYTDTITRIGVDVGFTTGGAMVWGVFADTNRYAGMLTGTYGATAEATVAAGLGANVLVRGSNDSVAPAALGARPGRTQCRRRRRRAGIAFGPVITQVTWRTGAARSFARRA